MDMTFSTTLYLTKADFTAAKTNLFLEALNVTMSVPMPDISIVSTTESAKTVVASKTIVVVTKISLRSGDSGTTSATPGFTFSELKAQLITNGFTSKVAGTGLPGAGLSDTDRFGTHFTDKGTVLDINQPTYAEVMGIIGNSSAVVNMVVQIPGTVADFNDVQQGKFMAAVANAADTPVDNIVINAIKEVTTTRRTSRKLLATAVEIDFSVKVADAAAANVLVSSGKLGKDKLDAQLILQGLPAISKVVTEAKAADSEVKAADNALASAHRAVPTMVVGMLAMCVAIFFSHFD